jgi:CBS domain-containing protein
MEALMNANSIMTRRLLTIGPNASVLAAAQLMLKRRVSGLPVVDAENRLVGIVTEGDLIRRTELATERHRPRWVELFLGPGRAAEEFTRAHGRRVEEIMTVDPYTVTEEAGLEDIVTLMEGHHIKRVPVVRQGRIVGIVSRANLLKALLQNAKYGEATTATDREIREAFLKKMDENAWAPSALVEAHVENGVVTLAGTILDERDRGALKVLAENIPGVKEVRDDLIWVDPYSGMVIGVEPIAVQART